MSRPRPWAFVSCPGHSGTLGSGPGLRSVPRGTRGRVLRSRTGISRVWRARFGFNRGWPRASDSHGQRPRAPRAWALALGVPPRSSARVDLSAGGAARSWDRALRAHRPREEPRAAAGGPARRCGTNPLPEPDPRLPRFRAGRSPGGAGLPDHGPAGGPGPGPGGTLTGAPVCGDPASTLTWRFGGARRGARAAARLSAEAAPGDRRPRLPSSARGEAVARLMRSRLSAAQTRVCRQTGRVCRM